jgi:glutathione S-transferase
MADDLARLLAETYRWQRRLGNQVIATPHCGIVANPAHPDVWEANHADEVTAKTEAEIDAVFAAMDRHLGHTPWRMAHTDCFTADAFLASRSTISMSASSRSKWRSRETWPIAARR